MITVKKLITPREWEKRKYEESIGSMGGWVKGHKWEEFIDVYIEEVHHYFEALKKYIVENNIRFSGMEHACIGYEDFESTPLFSDNTIAHFSCRGWSDLMAAIWNAEEKTDKYSYMDFYFPDD